MILQGGAQDTESNDDVTDNGDNDIERDGASDNDTASSELSNSLLTLKKAKMRRQQKCEKKHEAKLSRMQPKARKSKGTNLSSTASTTTILKDKKATKKAHKTMSDRAAPTKRNSRRKQSSTKDDTKDRAKTKTMAGKDHVPSSSDPPKKKDQEKREKAGDCTIDSIENGEEEDEEAACCLCHCGVDCSDRALFFTKDRKLELEEDEDYYFGLDDPYLDGEIFYDRSNALVYCDTCNRLYHQKCHFVPLLVVPRGEFHCLICSIQQQQQNKTSKKRERKGSIKSVSNQFSTMPEKFLKRKITDQLFQSPPTQSSKTIDIKSLEKEWEIGSGPAKARLWDLVFKQLRTFLKSQASNIRMANTTLATMTSTKRNRQHFLESSTKSGPKSSQELAQTLCKLTGAKFKIREALLSLESLRVNNESIDFSSLYPWCQKYPEHANHVFPFGSTFCKDGRRIVPRTRERKKEVEENMNDDIPSEVNVSGSTSKHSSRSNETSTLELVAKSPQGTPRSKRGEKQTTRTTNQKQKPPPMHMKSEEVNNLGNDDDSGITLDDLQCAVCMVGDATDENDVILCDGKDCHRAFHMNCVYPPVKKEDIENEDEDWFCPICSHSAELMGEIHDLCVGDENEEASSDSWEDIHDVFPGSQWEYVTATKILKGKRNEDTQRLLEMFLGDINKKKVQMPVGSDSEDENDYSLFDEDSFQDRRRQEREDENDGKSDDDDSICSSQATLQEMDGIDYKVGNAELAALSDEECLESNSDESENKIRRSRRLVKKEEAAESNPLDIGADFDEANIIVGKRKRNRVNYRKLNDMMFGDLSDHQQGIIDGGDDFDVASAKPMKTVLDNESDNNGSDDESNNDSSDNPDN